MISTVLWYVASLWQAWADLFDHPGVAVVALVGLSLVVAVGSGKLIAYIRD